MHFNVPHLKLNKNLLLQPSVTIHVDYNQGPGLQVVSRFIDAVCASPDDAWVYVSRIYSASLDLYELQEIFASGVSLIKVAAYASNSKNTIVRSLYASKNDRLLHVHMVKEPDGKWKIFGVEFEECARRR